MLDERLAVALVAAAAAGGLLLGLLIEYVFGAWQRRQLEHELERLGDRLTRDDALAAEREAAIGLAQERLAATFGSLANESLRHQSETFIELARQSLGAHHERARSDLSAREKAIEELVRPVADALKRTEAQIRELERARQEAYGSIHAQLRGMTETQAALQAETRNLVNALRRPEVRGQWGELTLRRLVELAGMVEHCDFVEQSHVRTDEGAIRPDMIVRMPDERELVVDVKTPLDAYLAAVQADSELARAEALRRHAAKVAERVRELSGKAYWSQFRRSPEFVILFIPGDQFLSAALNERPDLLEDALRQKVILATPSSFIALLKAVAYGWRQLALADNAEVIRGLAVDLYERMSVFTTHLARLGRELGQSVEAYNAAVGSLERMVLPGARKLTELGVQSRKTVGTLDPVETMPRRPAASGGDAAPGQRLERRSPVEEPS